MGWGLRSLVDRSQEMETIGHGVMQSILCMEKLVIGQIVLGFEAVR